MASDFSDLLGGDVPASGSAEAVPPATVAAVAGGVSTQGAFEGANRFDQMSAWVPPLRSADADLLPEKTTLDARSRDMLRNDAYVAGGATLHKDNIVGAVFQINAKPATKVLFGKEDEAWETEFQEEVETKFSLWAESPMNWPDAARINTLTELVRLAVGCFTAGGEVLGSAEWLPGDGRPFATALQLVDTDRLSTPPHLTYVNDKIRGGVERDRRGAPIAYHIRASHPSDYGNELNYVWRRVPARKSWGRPMILHIFEQNRPDQSRGVSAMVAALQEMKMTKGFRRVELQRAVVAATYGASIESDMPPGDVYAAMGVGQSEPSGDDTENPSLTWMQDYLAAVNQYTGGAKNLLIDGMRIPVFMPGTRLKLQNPGNTGPVGSQFEASLLRHIAAAIGVSYEQLSRDYTATNYSSARAAMGETWKHMLARKRLVADRTASFVYRLWLEEAISAGQIESLKRRQFNFWDGLNADAICAAEWIGAGRGLVDPLKETQADVLALKNGLATKEQIIAKRDGGDWRQVARQIAREIKVDESFGNPSVYTAEATDAENALSGTPQERDS